MIQNEKTVKKITQERILQISLNFEPIFNYGKRNATFKTISVCQPHFRIHTSMLLANGMD